MPEETGDEFDLCVLMVWLLSHALAHRGSAGGVSLELISSLHPLVLRWGQRQPTIPHQQISRRCLEPTASDHSTDT